MKLRGQLWGWLAMGLVASACRPPVTPAPPSGELNPSVDFEPTPLEPAEPANKKAGDQLDLLIPGVEDEYIDLAALRGKTVVLAVSGTTEAHWAELLAWLEQVQEADPAGRAAILVASDPEPDALDGVMSSVRLGWDPQGAVAARLSVARLPTVFLIDPQGQVQVVTPGFDPEHRASLESQL
jgi:hypothetical protein